MIRLGAYRLIGFNSRQFSIIASSLFNKSINNKESNLLRKLDSNESFYNKICSKGSNQIVYTISIDSKIDLYSNLNLLKTGIKLWKVQHPFLNSTVSSDEHGKYFMKVNNLEFLNNIEILNYKPFYELNDEIRSVYALYEKIKSVLNNESKHQVDESFEIVNVIHDIFLNTPSLNNEYLWKLSFIKLDSTQYCIVFISYYEITSQSASYSFMEQLLNIIDATYTNKPLTSEFHLIHQIPKPLEDYFQSKNNFELEEYTLDDSLFETKSHKIIHNGVITDNNDIYYPNYDKILNIRGEKLRLNKELTETFFLNCKSYNSDPACCVAILMSIALQKAFKKFDKAQKEIVYSLDVNLNKLVVGKKISHETLCNYDAQIIQKIHAENRDYEKSSLWKLASEETLKNDYSFSQMKLFDYSSFQQHDSNSNETNSYSKTYNFHFSISNFGSIQNFPHSIGNFKILDFKSGRTSTTPEFGLKPKLFNFYLLNINEELNVDFDVHTALKQEFTYCVIQTFKENFKKLIE
jgi:hypothetical protein